MFERNPIPATSGTFTGILKGLLHKEQPFFFYNQFVMGQSRMKEGCSKRIPNVSETTFEHLLESIVKKFGRRNYTVEDFKKEFEHQLTSGKLLHVKLSGTNVIIDFYALVSDDAKSRIISFRDTIKDNGDSSDELSAGFQMIRFDVTDWSKKKKTQS